MDTSAPVQMRSAMAILKADKSPETAFDQDGNSQERFNLSGIKHHPFGLRKFVSQAFDQMPCRQ